MGLADLIAKAQAPVTPQPKARSQEPWKIAQEILRSALDEGEISEEDRARVGRLLEWGGRGEHLVAHEAMRVLSLLDVKLSNKVFREATVPRTTPPGWDIANLIRVISERAAEKRTAARTRAKAHAAYTGLPRLAAERASLIADKKEASDMARTMANVYGSGSWRVKVYRRKARDACEKIRALDSRVRFSGPEG